MNIALPFHGTTSFPRSRGTTRSPSLVFRLSLHLAPVCYTPLPSLVNSSSLSLPGPTPLFLSTACLPSLHEPLDSIRAVILAALACVPAQVGDTDEPEGLAASQPFITAALGLLTRIAPKVRIIHTIDPTDRPTVALNVRDKPSTTLKRDVEIRRSDGHRNLRRK